MYLNTIKKKILKWPWIAFCYTGCCNISCLKCSTRRVQKSTQHVSLKENWHWSLWLSCISTIWSQRNFNSSSTVFPSPHLRQFQFSMRLFLQMGFSKRKRKCVKKGSAWILKLQVIACSWQKVALCACLVLCVVCLFYTNQPICTQAFNLCALIKL